MPKLPSPRFQYARDDLDAGSLAALRPLFEELQSRPLPDAAAAERWLLDESELQSRIGAESARRYIRMTCHTEDSQAREAYLRLEREVLPEVRVLADRLDRRSLAEPAFRELPEQRYALLLRQRRNASEIFRAENTPLQSEEAELQTAQQTLMGSIVVRFEGRDHTLQQVAPYFESQDRELRRRAWFAGLAARRAAWPEQQRILDRLLELRTTMARNAGFPTYTPYRFRELRRFDYGPEDCLRFHDAIEATVVPAVRELDAERARRLGLAALRPWDAEVDLDGRPPLRPFTTEPELIALCADVFARVDRRFADEFAVLQDAGLLDLMSRKGKAPGGYQYSLEDVRLPFIFANAVGTHGDVQTLLHEGGHAFHSLLSRDEDLAAYREAPIEFAETASMSMELMGLEEIGARYSDADRQRARRRHLEHALRILPWIASIDAFQHFLYGDPAHDRGAREREWLRIRARFGGSFDWSGIEDALAHQWCAQGHLYTHALYYVEYGIAQVAALQIWRRYRQDPRAAVEAYRSALALGGSRPLPELFATAGVRMDLSRDLLGELVAEIRAALTE
jgi:oligoendopeptidase F